MEKQYKMYLTKLVFSLIFIYASSLQVFSQTVRPIGDATIPQTVRDNQIVRGNMAFTGNTILGIRGIINGNSFSPNDDYNLALDNGRFTFQNVVGVDFLGNLILGTIEDNYNRAYVDIDDDLDPTIFTSATFRANSNNFDYGGSQDLNSSPTTGSNIGTFSSSAAELDIDATCGVVRRAYLYWSGLYPQESINTFTGINYSFFGFIFGTEVDPGASNNPRTSFGANAQSDYTEVKILPPGGDQYYNVSINPVTAPNPGGIELQTEVIVDGLDGSVFNIQSELDGENKYIAQEEARLGRPLTTTEIADIRNDVDVGDITGNPYVCVADVTDLLVSLQNAGQPVAGFWTVGNVRATTGYNRSLGLSGGWSLAVIYENDQDTESEKEITFFDGFSTIEGGDAPVEFETPTFNTIPEGPIRAWLASTSLEGDSQLFQDRLSIRTETIEARLGVGASVDLREENPTDNTNNFFNSTITDLNGVNLSRSPASQNTLGYDLDHFELINNSPVGNAILNNRADNIPAGITDQNATLILSTDADVYSNFFNAFAVEIIAPDIDVEKRAFVQRARLGADGMPDGTFDPEEELLLDTSVTPPVDPEINFGDILRYELVVRNNGNDTATGINNPKTFGIGDNILIEDFLPANTRFTTSSTVTSPNFTIDTSNLRIVNGETFIDRTTGLSYLTDKLEIDIPDLTPLGEGTNEITINLIDITVIDECNVSRNACIDRIENVALSNYRGVINTRVVDQKESFFRFPNGCGNLAQGPTVTLINKVGQCDSDDVVICADDRTLVAALGFTTYRWFRVESPTDQNGNGRLDDADYGSETGPLRDFINNGTPLPSGITEVIDADPSTPNEIVVNSSEPGLYVVIEIAPVGCNTNNQNRNAESFDVTVFDPLAAVNNPFIDNITNTPILGGEILTPVCTPRPDLDIVQFVVCGNAPNDNITIPIPGGYPNDTAITVSKYVEGSCTRDEINCPFVAGTCNYTDEFTLTLDDLNRPGASFTIDETGNYRFTATIPGGCSVIEYFNVVIVRQDLDISPDVNECSDQEIVEVTGLPARTSTTSLLYDLRFFINIGDGSGFVEQAFQDPSATVGGLGFFANDSDYGRFTVNRPTSPTNNIVNIRIDAIPKLTGSTAATVATINNCPPPLQTTVTFLNLNEVDFRFLRTPSCGEDSALTTDDDETKGDIVVEVSSGSPQYFYQLINTNGTDANVADDTVEATFGPTTNTNHVFKNVDPEIRFKARVFGSNEATISVNSPVVASNNCIIETGIIETDEVVNIVATIQVTKPVTCTPGEVTVTLSAPGNPGFDLSTVDFQIPELNNRGGTGETTVLSVDDITNEPPPPLPTDPPPPPGAVDVIYVDLAPITDLTVIVLGNPSCVNPSQTPNSLTLYNGIKLEEDSKSDVRCNGDSNGDFTVQAFENDATNTVYISPHADGSTPTVLEYDITNAPASAPPSILDPQTSPSYSGLPAGEYRIIVTDITDPLDRCSSEELIVNIIEPPILVTPVIELVQPYTCTPAQNASITVQGLPAAAFGGTPGTTTDYTFELRDDNGTPGNTPADTADDTVFTVNGSANLPITGITEGSYELVIIDSNNCRSPLSNTINIEPLSTVTFNAFTPPILVCNTTATTSTPQANADIDLNATADNGGTIAGYRIIEIDGAAITPLPPFTDNTTGEFNNLVPGDYIIEAGTTITNCTERLSFTIEPLFPIQLGVPNPRNVVCRGDATGSVTAVVNRFDPTQGYDYTLSLNGSVLQTSASPITDPNFMTVTGLTGLSASTNPYTLRVIDVRTGCFDERNFTITEPATLPSVTASVPVFDCTTGNYNFTVTPSGGTPGTYEYSLDDATFTSPQTSNSFSIMAPAVTTTFTVSVRDDRDCVGTPVDITLNPITPISASLNNTASNLCLPNTVANPVNIVFDVTGTNDFRYKLSTSATFEIATAVGGQITIANPPTSSGTYTYQVLDANFNRLDNAICFQEVTFTIEDPITTTTPVRPTLDCSATAPLGSLPTTGEYVEFTVNGGVAPYIYTIREVVGSTPGPASTPTNLGTNTTPRFGFTPAEDGRTFRIEITDSATTGSCTTDFIDFVPNYPEAPAITSVIAGTIDCYGDDTTLTINPTLTGSQTLASFEYSFDGGTTFQSGNSTTINLGTNLSQVFNVSIRNVITQCRATDSQTVNQPQPIVEVVPTRMLTQVTCVPTADPTMPTIGLGSFTTTFTGGSPNFSFELFDNNDIGAGALQTLTAQPSRTITFPNLDVGEYLVIIEDSNSCQNVDPIIFTINPTPDIQIIDSFFDPISCAGGVDLYFEVQGGSSGAAAADLFRIGNVLGGATISPAAPGDNIQKFGNPDFPLTTVLPAGAAGFDPDRLFRIRGLDFNSPLDIFIEDSATGCSSAITRFNTPAGPSNVAFINVTPTNAGACNSTTGAVDVTFDVTDPASVGEDFEIDIFRVFDNQLLTPTSILISPTVATNNVVPQITGLPIGELRVRVRQVTGGSVCSNSDTFDIGRATPLTGPFIVNNLPANCNNGAQIEVRSEGGTPAYQYQLVRVGDPTPLPTSSFALSNTFEIDPSDPIITPALPTAMNPNRIGQVEVWVRDFNGCISGPLLIDVDEDKTPDLTIEPLGAQECGDGPFTVNVSVDDYQDFQTYTYTINGGPAQNITLTETAPSSGIATGTFQVTARGDYDVVIAGNAQPLCTDTESFRIFERLSVDVTSSEPNCDGEFNTVTADVTNGFDGVTTRRLTYELFEDGTSVTSQNSTSTTFTFTNGIGGVTLEAGKTYRVLVTDTFDPAASPLRSCQEEDSDTNTAIVLPTIDTSVTNLTCPDNFTGQITIDLVTVGDTPPVSYELYEFADSTAATAAITAGTVRTIGTSITSGTGNNVFANLKGQSQGVYIPVVIATASNCPIIGSVISLTEAEDAELTDFTVNPVAGVCNNIDPLLNSSARITIDINASAPTANYTVTIPGIITNGPLSGTATNSFDVNSSPTANTNYTVTINSDGNTCDPLTYNIVIPPCPEPIIPPDPLVVGTPAPIGVLCFGDTNGSVTISVGPANGNVPPTYSYSITGGSPATTRTTASSSANQISETNLPPGNYTFAINDLDEPTSTAITGSFIISTPTSLPDFTVGALTYDCTANTVSVTATPVAGSGTPTYRFELDDPATVADPDFTSMTGVFNNIPAPIVGSGATINYEITIFDANNCDESKPLDVNEQPQLVANITTPNECLPNGTTTTAVEVRIDFTSGTPPYEFARIISGNPAPTVFTAVPSTDTFIVDNTITTDATYDYYLRDSNGCQIIRQAVINPQLSLTSPPMRTEPSCDLTDTTLPQDRTVGRYEFTVTGGDTSVPYTVEIASGASATTIGTFSAYTGIFPVTGANAFEVMEANDGIFFQFRITDDSGCSLLLEPFSFDFPDSPTATSTRPAYFCVGETATATVTVSGGSGPFSYSFDGGAFQLGVNTFTDSAGTYNYTVRDANNCFFDGTLTIDDNSLDINGPARITDISCSAGMPATNSGEISIDIIGGTAPYNFTIISESTGSVVGTAVQSPANPVTTPAPFTITFSSLTADSYRVEVTDGNGCPVRRFEGLEVETISPITLSPPIFIDDCNAGGGNTGITVVFSINGTAGPFTIASIASGLQVDPTIAGDDVSQFGDGSGDFPASFTFPAGTPPSVQSSFYAVSGLNYGQTYTIEVIDTITSCPENTDYTTPDSGLVEIILGTQVPESECNPSGDAEQPLTFQRLTGTATDYDVVLLDPITGVVIPIVGLSPQIVTVNGAGLGTPTPFTGLDDGDYQVRVTERRLGVSTLCGATESFNITRAVALEAPTINSTINVNCNSNPATFTINVSATGGRLPYSFIARLATAPVSTTADFTTIGSAGPDIPVDYSTGLSWVLDVMDNSTCGIVSTPFTIVEQPDPTLTIDPNFSKDQCEGEARFRFDIQITNYDVTFEPYTFEVNGVAQTLSGSSIMGTTLSGELEVTTRGTFTVEVENKDGCSDTENITIYDELQITAVLANPTNCDEDIPTITGTVTGGFDFALGTGSLTYDLVNPDVLDTDPSYVLATTTIANNVAVKQVIFTSLVGGVPQLLAGNNYAIRVTDNFGGTASAPSCNATSDPVRQEELGKTTLLATTNTPISCNGADDATVTINFDSATPGDNPIFSLFRYATLADATLARDNDDPAAAAGIMITASATNNRLFENLEPGFYVDFVSNASTRPAVFECFTGNSAFEIIDPNAFTPNFNVDIVVTPQHPRCTPETDAKIIVTINTLSEGTPPYFYRLTIPSIPSGLTDPFILIPETDVASPTFPIVIEIDATAGTEYAVQFRDSGDSSCPTVTAPPVSINDLVNPIASIALDATQPNGGALSCTNDEQILVSVDNAQASLGYTFEVTQQPTGSTLVTTPQTVTAPAVGPFIVRQPYALSIPGLYEFRIINVSTGCDTTVEHRIDPLTPLRLRVIPVDELECVGDTDMVSFEVQDYTGFFRYRITNSIIPPVTEEGVVDMSTGTITAISPIPSTASFNTTTNVLTSGIALGRDNYSITVTATNDGIPTITSGRTECMSTATINIAGPDTPVSLAALNSTPQRCDKFATITGSASGGTPPYQYQLVEVDDINRTNVLRILVDFGPPNLTPNTTGFFGEDLMIDGGTTSFRTYRVRAVDSNGCTGTTAEQFIRINRVVSPTILISPTVPNCDNDTIDITVTSVAGTAALTTLQYSLIEVDDLLGTNPSDPLVIQTANTVFADVRPGINGEPRFFRVDVLDGNGCAAMSNIISSEAPAPLEAGNRELIPIDCDTSRPGQNQGVAGAAIETAQYEISISGGAGPYNYERSSGTFAGGATPPLNPLGQVSTTANTAVYELPPGRHFFRITDSNNCEAFTSVTVGPAPDPIEFEIEFEMETLCPEVLGFVDLDGSVRGGVPGPIYRLYVVDGAAATQVVDGSFNTVSNETDSPRFSGLPDVRGFTDPVTSVTFSTAAEYEYRVSAGNCPEVSKSFSISQFPVLLYTLDSTNVSCAEEEDATGTVTLTSGIQAGTYTVLLVQEEGVSRNVTSTSPNPDFANGTIEGTLNIATGIALPINTATNSVTFENLAEGDYSVIISTPNGCIPADDVLTINRKEEFEVTFIDVPGSRPDCEGDAPGTRRYRLEGGTPPYYYAAINVTAGEEQPDAEDIFGVAANRIIIPTGDTSVEFTITGPNPGETFENNVDYQIFFVDSGNGPLPSAGTPVDLTPPNNFGACEEQDNEFVFDVPDLTGFTVETEFICEPDPNDGSINYRVTVNLPNNSTLVPERVTYVLLNQTEGRGINPEEGTKNVFIVREGSEIRVTLDYVRPDNMEVCSSDAILGGTVIKLLESRELLTIQRQLVEDENGVLQPTGLPYELIGLNKYRVTALGGEAPYSFEILNTTTKNQVPVEIDLRGRGVFTITESATGSKPDNYAINVRDSSQPSCGVQVEVPIDFIDIEVPNVFNPAAGPSSGISTWYPENLNFGDAIDNFPDEGVIVDEGDSVITVTVGGTTTGGETTGGTTIVVRILPPDINNPLSPTVRVIPNSTVTGGNIINRTPPTGGTITNVTLGGSVPNGQNVPGEDTGVVTSGSGTTIVTTTIGGIFDPVTNTNTGGTTIITTTVPSSNGGTPVTTVSITENTTVTGATITPSGIVVGGFITTTSGSTPNIPIITSERVETVQEGGTIIESSAEFINFANMEVMVFDRYGRLLEEFKGIKDRSAGEGWDGTYQGKPLPTGDYWYLIKLNDSRGREIRGHFTLYRSKL